MNHYHNTTGLSGAELNNSEGKARNQDENVLLYFCSIYPKGATPSEVHPFVGNSPITSTRRAISNLTDAGKLVKTEERRPGPYGKPECVWVLATPTNVDADADDQPELFPVEDNFRRRDTTDFGGW